MYIGPPCTVGQMLLLLLLLLLTEHLYSALSLKKSLVRLWDICCISKVFGGLNKEKFIQ